MYLMNQQFDLVVQNNKNCVGMLVTLSPKATHSQPKLNFTFKSTRYNQYVQTHMSWNEEKHLTKQQKQLIPVSPLPSIPKPSKLQIPSKPSNAPLIPMPIPYFQLDRINPSELSDDEDLKTSNGVPKLNNFSINSQHKSTPFKALTLKSAETQTNDFTFIHSLFPEPKIYEIPVEMEVQESPDLTQTGIQVSQILLQTLLQKLQQPSPAVFTSPHLRMDSAVLSMSVQNYSFQRSHQFNQKNPARPQINENDDNDSEQIYKGLEEEEMLLETEPMNEIKQNLFKTANFEYPYTQTDFYTVSTPQKSGISGSQSSPDTNGPMRISENEVNMMHNRQMVSSKIDEEEYEDLQSRFYILEQENAQKVDQIEGLSKKVRDLEREFVKLQKINVEKEAVQEKCLKLQKQLQLKSIQQNRLSQTLQITQQQLQKCQQAAKYKQSQLYEVLQAKQRQLQQLQSQLKQYREQLASGEEKYCKENQDMQNYVTEKEHEMNDLRAQYDRKYELYILSINQMKDKIQSYQAKMEQFQNAIAAKDAKINSYKDQFLKLKEENAILCKRIHNDSNSEQNMRQQQATISISDSHHFTKFPSYSFQKNSKKDPLTYSHNMQLELYSNELQKIVLTYENVIQKQLQTIEELEEKVLEFLKDALTKESQTELLSSQLCQYENNLNGLMVEKLSMELENQRLNKMINQSENKLAVLGSRLIRLAKTNSCMSSRNEEQRNASSTSSIEEHSQR